MSASWGSRLKAAFAACNDRRGLRAQWDDRRRNTTHITRVSNAACGVCLMGAAATRSGWVGTSAPKQSLGYVEIFWGNVAVEYWRIQDKIISRSGACYRDVRGFWRVGTSEVTGSTRCGNGGRALVVWWGAAQPGQLGCSPEPPAGCSDPNAHPRRAAAGVWRPRASLKEARFVNRTSALHVVHVPMKCCAIKCR